MSYRPKLVCMFMYRLSTYHNMVPWCLDNNYHSPSISKMTVSIEACWYVWSLIRLEGKKDINYEPPPLFIAHHAGSFMNLKYWPFFSMSSLVIDDLLSPASQLIALGLQDLLVSFPSSTFSYSSSCSESLLLFFSAPVIEMSPWRGFYGSWEILEDLRYVVFYHSSCRSHTPLSSSS